MKRPAACHTLSLSIHRPVQPLHRHRSEVQSQLPENIRCFPDKNGQFFSVIPLLFGKRQQYNHSQHYKIFVQWILHVSFTYAPFPTITIDIFLFLLHGYDLYVSTGLISLSRELGMPATSPLFENIFLPAHSKRLPD